MDVPAILQSARGGKALLIAGALMFGLAGLSALIRRKSPETHKRGVLLIDGRELQRRTSRRKKSGAQALTLAGVAIAAADETKHFKLIGTTGTGKSTAIRELLGAALARGDRAVFADPDGGYLARFHDRYRGDIVLNPFEANSVKWDLFAEIHNSYDVEQLASGLIPASDDPSATEWRGYARTFLTAVVRRCHARGRRDTADLWRLLTMASAEELRPIRRGHAGTALSRPRQCRMFGSIRSVTGSAIAALEYIQAAARPRLLGARLGPSANTAGCSVHSLQGRANRGIALDDRDLDASRHIRGHEPGGRPGSAPVVRRRRARCVGRHRRSQRRAGAPAKIRVPLRAGVSIDRPGLRVPMARAKRRRLSRTAAILSSCAAPAAKTAARRNSPPG